TMWPFGSTAIADTPVAIPAPSGAHAVPSHRAMPGVSTGPEWSIRPAATTSPFDMRASEWTIGAAQNLPRPSPSADHAVPSQRAMLCAAVPPAVVNDPAAITLPSGSASSAVTGPSTPDPSAGQALPSQHAALAAGTE